MVAKEHFLPRESTWSLEIVFRESYMDADGGKLEPGVVQPITLIPKSGFYGQKCS